MPNVAQYSLQNHGQMIDSLKGFMEPFMGLYCWTGPLILVMEPMCVVSPFQLGKSKNRKIEKKNDGVRLWVSDPESKNLAQPYIR